MYWTTQPSTVFFIPIALNGRSKWHKEGMRLTLFVCQNIEKHYVSNIEKWASIKINCAPFKIQQGAAATRELDMK